MTASDMPTSGNAAKAGETSPTLLIEVVSDAVCPWCFVGKRNLEAALQEFGGARVEVRWRPYQLDATIPAGGMSRSDYLSRKFGPKRGGQMNARLSEAGRERGIAFAFERIERSPNTLDAHRLIRWAQARGKQDEVVERLFQLYFEQGKDIGDDAVLADVAEAIGMDRPTALRLLASDTDRAEVRQEIAAAQKMGVNGVPFFIFGGKYALSGAQPPEELAAVIRKTLDDAADEPA